MLADNLRHLFDFKLKNNFVLLITIGLIVVEKFMETDFVCPCSTGFRACFFSMYLLTPAFIASTLACFYTLSHSEESASNVPANKQPTEDPENSQTNRQQQRPRKRTGIFTVVEWLQCLIPSVIWVILFLSDGRYVACLSTTLEGENADSSVHPAWEWCDHNRTLTGNQKYSQKSFYVSKIVGFVLLFAFSLVALIFVCYQKRKEQTSSEQVRTCKDNELHNMPDSSTPLMNDTGNTTQPGKQVDTTLLNKTLKESSE